MPDTSDKYINLVCNAAPFAHNDAGIPQMVELIKALAAERDDTLRRFAATLVNEWETQGLERMNAYLRKIANG